MAIDYKYQNHFKRNPNLNNYQSSTKSQNEQKKILKSVKELQKKPSSLFNNQNKKDIDALRDKITLWKVQRTNYVDTKTLMDALDLAKNLEWDGINIVNKNTKENEESKIEDLIKKMISFDGADLPMASTILKFFNEDVFAILDHRDYRAVFKLNSNQEREYDEGANAVNKAKTYIDFLKECKKYSDNPNSIIKDFKDIDTVLYNLDKKMGNTVKKSTRMATDYSNYRNNGYYLF